MRSVVFAVLLAVSLSFPCLAQRDTNISTRASLTVYVAFTNERALGKSIEVRVYQRGQILFGESFTDERGRAKFDQVPAGYYHVEVQGTVDRKDRGPRVRDPGYGRGSHRDGSGEADGGCDCGRTILSCWNRGDYFCN